MAGLLDFHFSTTHYYSGGTTAYLVVAAAYQWNSENKSNSVNLAEAGTELGDKPKSKRSTY